MSREYDPSNEPDTCLWCGDRLRHSYDTVKEQTGKRAAPAGECYSCMGHEYKRIGPDDWDQPFACASCGTPYYGRKVERIVSRTQRSEKPGAYADGYFCTGVCARYFATAAARNGYRFQPKSKLKELLVREGFKRACPSCTGYGYFDENGQPTIDKRGRKCGDCTGEGART